jgi:hypothetical protein
MVVRRVEVLGRVEVMVVVVVVVVVVAVRHRRRGSRSIFHTSSLIVEKR